MTELQRILAVVEALLKRSLERVHGRSDLRTEFPLLATEIKAAIDSCEAQQIDSLLIQLSHIATAFSGKRKDGPQGFEHFSIELNLNWNELRKLSLEQAVVPAWKSGTLRENFRTLVDTLSLLKEPVTGALLRKIETSLGFLSELESTFSTPKKLHNVSARDEKKLIQTFSALSEHLTDINLALLSSERASVQRQRGLMVQQWNAIVHQVGEIMVHVYRARTGKDVAATSRQGVARIEL